MTKEQNALLAQLPPEFQIFWKLMTSYMDAKFKEAEEATAAHFETIGLQIDEILADIEELKAGFNRHEHTFDNHERRLMKLETKQV